MTKPQAAAIVLTKALEKAAVVDQATSVENILETLDRQFPALGPEAAERAINRAVYAHRWTNVQYLSNYLIAHPPDSRRGSARDSGLGAEKSV